MKPIVYPTVDTLIEFAIESNAIEGAPTALGQGATENQVMAATHAILNAMQHLFPWPTLIHKELFLLYPALMDQGEVGRYRGENVRVGGAICPLPILVPELMRRLGRAMVATYNQEGGLTEADCWRYHHIFECIHPFIDGNGRVGRILLNHLRILAGLPWLIIYDKEKQAYYQSIREFRDRKWPAYLDGKEFKEP